MKRTTYLLMSSLISLFSVDCYSQQGFLEASENYSHPIEVHEPLNFGNGYNSTTNEEFFGVMIYENLQKNTEIVSNATGNKGKTNFSRITSKDSLREVLDISVKADLNIKYGAVSSNNSLKYDYYKETTISHFSDVAVISSKYINTPRVLINPQVKKEWIKLAKKNPDEFMRTCGDMFVSKIYTGGEMYAIFENEVKNEYEKEKSNLFFSTANSYLGNQLNASYKKETIVEQLNSIKNKKVYIFTNGGKSIAGVDDITKFLETAFNFKEDVSTENSPAILYVELTPYENIAGFPKVNFNKIRVDQKLFLEKSSAILDEFSRSISNANFVLQNPKRFYKEDFVDAVNFIDSAYISIEQISSYMRKVRTDFDLAENDEVLDPFSEIAYFSKDVVFDYVSPVKGDCPFTVNEGWKTISENTGKNNSKKFFNIIGKLESSDKNDINKRSFKSCVYSPVNVYHHTKKKTKGNWRGVRRWYIKVHENFTQPYYEIRYIDVQTQQVVGLYKWKGTPIGIRDNAEIQVRLVNPNAYLTVQNSSKRYSSSNYKTGPKYTSITVSESNKPKWFIVDNTKPLTSSNSTLTISNLSSSFDGGLDIINITPNNQNLTLEKKLNPSTINGVTYFIEK